MDSRCAEVQMWIDSRKERNELTNMVFYITVVATIYYDFQATINKVIDLLNRNNVTYQQVDTISGAWNLNRDWLETDIIPCAVEYCGCYPANWNIEDVIKLEELERDGEIVIMAYEKTDDGEYVPNH